MKIELDSFFFSDESWRLPPRFGACWDARGIYSPMQFVLRLRPDIHRVLKAEAQGVSEASKKSEASVAAFSTYLHETIHWWQHVGSSSGLFLSLLYPAQSHVNYDNLRMTLDEIGAKISLRNYDSDRVGRSDENARENKNVNIILNNWHDIEFYRWLILDSKNFTQKAQDNYFECVGHSYRMAIDAVLWLITNVVDPTYEFFADPSKWRDQAKALAARKAPGFYYGSPIYVQPIGVKEIFEGQARLSQLQYLYIASRGEKKWNFFVQKGFLDDIYGKAFSHFIKWSGLTKADHLDSPVVGLFLMICDLAINPSEFFLNRDEDVSRIVNLHDPGFRFHSLCCAVAGDVNYFSHAINLYSTENYWEVSTRLSELAGLSSPKVMADLFKVWSAGSGLVSDLLEEDRAFSFSEENLPIRVFVARYIKFQMDKCANPEFFCWPGIHLTNHAIDEGSLLSYSKLFNEHAAIFVDGEDGDVYPKVLPNRDPKNVERTFSVFYSWIGVYDLTRQWMVGEGDFNFDFGWLTSKYGEDELKEWVCMAFASLYGVSPDSFDVINI